MKGLIRCMIVMMLISCMAANTSEPAYQGTSVSLQVFYDELSPYGRWIHDPVYGYVWVPDAGPDFWPYSTSGYWVFTDFGWTWVSHYPWGWAPFHYGRWYYDPFYGAVWVPGYEWGPAWVCWRHSGGYYGWAPLQPGISISVGYSNYNPGPKYWRFVRQNHFGSTNISNYYETEGNNANIIRSSTVIRNTHVDNVRNTTYIAGPERGEVQKVTKTQVKPVSIEDNNRPGEKLSGGRLQLYRPHVQRDNSVKAAPEKFENAAQKNNRVNVPTHQPPVKRESQEKNKQQVKPPPDIRQSPPTQPEQRDRSEPPAVAPSQRGNTPAPEKSPSKNIRKNTPAPVKQNVQPVPHDRPPVRPQKEKPR